MPRGVVHPAWPGSLGLAFLMILIWQLSVPTLAQPQVPLAGKNVLIMHSHEATAPIFILTDKGLLTTLESGGIPSSNQFVESLDLRRNSGPEYRKALVEKMRVQYSHRKIDVIITMYPEALAFVLNECRNIFSEVPIVALYLQQSIKPPKGGRYIFAHSATIDILGTLEIALKLVPGTKRVYVVSGVDQVDKAIEAEARRDLKKWEAQLEFIYLSHLSLEDVLATVSSVPPRSIILQLIFTQDVKGTTTYTYPVIAQRLSQVSAAPIFGIIDSGLGHGIVGGNLYKFETTGARAGQLVLDILRGTQGSENIGAVLDVPPAPMFDWRQFRRWQLSDDALPKESIVINKELTLWDFRYYIIGGSLLILVQLFLIVGLLVQKHQRRLAEESLRKKTDELDQFFNVTLDLVVIANTDGYFLHLNAAWEKVLGFTCEELMAKQFFEFVHPDDLDRTREAFSALTLQHKLMNFENRFRCKDGTYRFLEWTAAPTGQLFYAAARDITERKRTEEAFRTSEKALKQNEYDLRMLAGRLIHAHEEERSRLARELHDDLAQRLAIFAIDVGQLEPKLIDLPAPVREALREMKDDIIRISGDVHSLSRQLHPSILDDLGLIKAVEAECIRFLRREGVETVFKHENVPKVVPKNISLAFYRIVQEGLANISKYACAEHILVSLMGFRDEILLMVQDDGIGFDLAEFRKKPSLGLFSMRERARLIHGEFSITSGPGKGTVITVRAKITKEGE